MSDPNNSVHNFISFEMPDITEMFLEKLRDNAHNVSEVRFAPHVPRLDDPYASFSEADARLVRVNVTNKYGHAGLIIIGHYRGNGLVKVLQCVPENMRHLVVITSHDPLDDKQVRNYAGLGVRHFALRERRDDESGTPSFLETFMYFAETGKILERASALASAG